MCRPLPPSLASYCSALKNLKLTEERVAKVVKDRIFSAAFHPSTSSLLVAAGDKWGKVGLWNLVSFILLSVVGVLIKHTLTVRRSDSLIIDSVCFHGFTLRFLTEGIKTTFENIEQLKSLSEIRKTRRFSFGESFLLPA